LQKIPHTGDLMRLLTLAVFSFIYFLFPGDLARAAITKGCVKNFESSLKVLRSTQSDPDERIEEAKCLLKYHISKSEVAQAGLKIIKDPNEDLFLREDLVQAFGEATLRRSEKVEEALAPEVNDQDREALGRTVASSAQDLLAITSAVKSMNEVIPTTRWEGEYFRTLHAIVLDDANHILFRETAMQALELASKKVVESGLYDDRLLRQSFEALSTVAAREDITNTNLQVDSTMERLASAGLPYFKNLENKYSNPGRMLSSELKPKP
jgi:hypothetical protein